MDLTGGNGSSGILLYLGSAYSRLSFGIHRSLLTIISVVALLLIIAIPALVLYNLSSPASLSEKGIYTKAFDLVPSEARRIERVLNEPSCKTIFGSPIGVSPGGCLNNLVLSYYVGAFLVPLMLLLMIGVSSVGKMIETRIRTKFSSERAYLFLLLLSLSSVMLVVTYAYAGILGCLYISPIVIVPFYYISSRKGGSYHALVLLMISYYLLMSLYRISVLEGLTGSSMEQCVRELFQLNIIGYLRFILSSRSRSTFWLINHLETVFGISFLLTAFPLLVFLANPGKFVLRRSGDRAILLKRSLGTLTSFVKFWYLIFRQVILRSKGYLVVPFVIGLLLTLFVAVLPFIRFWLHSSTCLNIDSLSDLYQDVDVIAGTFLLWGLPMAGFAITPEELINKSVGTTLRRILIKNPRKIVIIGSGRLVKSLLHNMRDKYGFSNSEVVLFEDEMLKVHRVLVLIDYDEFVAHKRYEDEVFGKIGVYIMKDTAIICLLGERESQSPDFKLKDSKERLHVLSKFTDYFEAIVIASRSPRVQNGVYKMLRGEYFKEKYGVLLISVEQNSQLKVLFSMREG